MFDTMIKLLSYLVKNKHDRSKFPTSFNVFDVESGYKRARKYLVDSGNNNDIGISKDPDKSKLWFRLRKKS